jgi:hypothetical protein
MEKDHRIQLTVAAIGAAAVIGAAVIAAHASNSSGGNSTPQTASSVVVAAPTTTTASSPQAVTNAGSTVAGAAPAVQFSGTVRLDGLKLDPIPPVSGAGGSSDVGFEWRDTSVVYGVLSVKVALWVGSTAPSEEDCSSLVTTQGVSSFEGSVTVKPGSIVCVITGAGRTASLQILSTHQNPDFAMVNTTVWELT